MLKIFREKCKHIDSMCSRRFSKFLTIITVMLNQAQVFVCYMHAGRNVCVK